MTSDLPIHNILVPRFRKLLMTSLHVICGLGLPNQKSWLRLCTNTGYEQLEEKFERAVLTHVGQDGSEMAVCLQSFFGP